jgi:hypothetical protein
MDYFIQNGGKKKRTKTESNSLKSKKSGGNFLGNLENLKGKKAKDTIKKGGACTLMDKSERESRGMAALMNSNEELVDSLLVEEEFRKICVKKQDEYRIFESEISRLIHEHSKTSRTEFPKDQIEQLKERWANGANEYMKRKLNDFITQKPDWRSRSFLTNFKTNILDDERLKLCYTEKKTEPLNRNQLYNSRTTTNMYVRFNNIFETKTKLNSLLKKNNSRQKTKTSSDMFNRLLAQASSQGHATRSLNSNNTFFNNSGSRGGPAFNSGSRGGPAFNFGSRATNGGPAFNSGSRATNGGPAKKTPLHWIEYPKSFDDIEKKEDLIALMYWIKFINERRQEYIDEKDSWGNSFNHSGFKTETEVKLRKIFKGITTDKIDEVQKYIDFDKNANRKKFTEIERMIDGKKQNFPVWLRNRYLPVNLNRVGLE